MKKSFLLMVIVSSISFGKIPEREITLQNFLWTKFPVEYSESDPNNNKNTIYGVGRLYLNFEKGFIEIIGLRESAQEKNRYNLFFYKIMLTNSIKLDSLSYTFEGKSDNLSRKISGIVEFEPINPEMSMFKIKKFEMNYEQISKITNVLSKKGQEILLKFNDVNFEDKGTINSKGEIMKNTLYPPE